MPDVKTQTQFVMPSSGTSTGALVDYEMAKFRQNNGTVTVGMSIDSGTVNAGTINAGTINAGTINTLKAIYEGTPATITSGSLGTLHMDSVQNILFNLAVAIFGEDGPNNVLGVQHKPIASATYSPSAHYNMGAASGTGVAVKASTGNVYSALVTNGGTSVRYFQLFNSATALANGGTPVMSYPLQAASTAAPYVLPLDSSHFAPSEYFSTGIAAAISSTNGTLGTAGVVAADHNWRIAYV